MRKITYIALAFILVVLEQGCGKHQEEKRLKRDGSALQNVVWVDTHPTVGKIYMLKDPNAMGCVRSTKEQDLYYIPGDPDMTVAVLINSQFDYSDGELLRKGSYRYEGNRLCEIDDVMEVGDNARMVKRNAKCRYFVEVVEPNLAPQK